jgi:hypothetical protein
MNYLERNVLRVKTINHSLTPISIGLYRMPVFVISAIKTRPQIFSNGTQMECTIRVILKNLSTPTSKTFKELALHYFIQYHLHLQLKEAADYAHKKGVVLKGDIPIGIYPVWLRCMDVA